MNLWSLRRGRREDCFFSGPDRFWESQRGLKVLAKLGDKAAEQQLPLVVQGLEQLRTEINKLFAGQFLYYAPERFSVLPQSTMIRKVCQLANDNETEKIFEYIDQNLEAFDGHFFIIWRLRCAMLDQLVRTTQSNFLACQGVSLLAGAWRQDFPVRSHIYTEFNPVLEATCSLIRELLRASSVQKQIEIFVDRANLDTTGFLTVCRDGQRYGFSSHQSGWLLSRSDHFSTIIIALSGEFSRTVPSILYGTIGMSYRLRGDFEKAKTYYLYAFHTAANNEERAMALSSYGTLEMQQERLESAASTLKRALRICEDGEITGKTYVTILNNLGLVAKEQAANDSGVHYLEKASAQAKKSGLSESYLMARVNLADLHRQDGQYSRGHEILDEIETMVKGTWAKDAVQTLRSTG